MTAARIHARIEELRVSERLLPIVRLDYCGAIEALRLKELLKHSLAVILLTLKRVGQKGQQRDADAMCAEVCHLLNAFVAQR